MTITQDNHGPDCGDIGWINFDPRVGREQSGNRPALILTPAEYNLYTGSMIVCPITSNMSPYSWKVMLPEGLKIRGAILVDQAKGIDYRARGCAVVDRAPEAVMAEVKGRLAALLGFELTVSVPMMGKI